MIIAMGGFEAYEVRSWQEHGLVVRFASARRVNQSARRHGKWVVAIAVSLAAYALPDRAIDGAASQAALHWDSVAPRIRAIAPSGGDGLPDRYWLDLMGKMRQWKAVAESGVIGPEPIV